MQCPHAQFEAQIDVSAVTDLPGQYNVKGMIVCKLCKQPLRFNGPKLESYFAIRSVMIEDHQNQPPNQPVPKQTGSDSQFLFNENGEIIKPV